jgi:hypothetical protein
MKQQSTSSSSQSSSSNVLQHADIQDLEWQMKQLLPLTWLEAALFFACMANTAIGAAAASSSSLNGSSTFPHQDPVGKNNVDQWMNLALDRLKSYEHCISSSGGPPTRC